jgi:hypothetical protein
MFQLNQMRKYKEAEEIKNKLRTLEAECEESWAFKH